MAGLAICNAGSLLAGGIKGKVIDKVTGEPLIGATVYLENTKYATAVNLDGTFSLKHVPAGKYELEVKFVGYKKSEEVEVVVGSEGEEKVIDFAMEAAATQMGEVTIKGGKNNGSNDESARTMEKNADNVINLLSARNIELSPDVTVGTAMQRVSGVTVQRGSSGEARYAIIRGMDQRYNNVLVNGIKIASPDDKYRFVPMDLFPSELLERLEVIKALTPNMEGDAIGGTMNLVMKEAPDHFLLTANASGGYSTLFSERPFSAFYHGGINQKSPAEMYGNSYNATEANFPLSALHYYNVANPINGTLGLTLGDRFLNKKLGFIISGAYQNFYRGSNTQMVIPDAQPNAVPPKTPQDIAHPQQLSISDADARQYSTQTDRFAINNKIDYIFDSRNKISLYNFYVHQNEYQTRSTIDTNFGVNSSANSYEMQYENRSTWTIQNIYNATLQGNHQLSDKVKVDWTGAFSDAQKKIPDQAWNTFDGEVVLNGAGKAATSDSTAGGMKQIWSHNQDRDWSGFANLTYTPRIAQRDVEFEGGGMYRDKTRTAYYNEYDLASSQPSTTLVHSLDSIPYIFNKNGEGSGALTAINFDTYTVYEKVSAGYLQAKFLLTHALQVLGGVRVENTQQNYTTDMPANTSQGYGSIHYTDVLPSLHLKYALTDQQNLRLSYFKSISRPGFGEIVPYSYPGEFYTEIGNPNLKHTRADNLDFRYEWFPGLADQILVGAFYKQLQNPIEYFVTGDGLPSSNFIQPQNVNKATNYGLEAVVTKYFGMFGVSLNYTYTHSKVTTAKLFYHYVGTTIQTDTVSQTRPLQGQADNIGNIAFLYKNPKLGLDLQIALSYTGDRIAQVEPYYEEDIWQKAYTQLDFSGEKKLSKRLWFFAKVNNLTDAPNQLYIKFPHGLVPEQPLPFQGSNSNITNVERDYYRINFLAGFRFKL
jgi:outer membrane receptor protein involved in Fe transport